MKKENNNKTQTRKRPSSSAASKARVVKQERAPHLRQSVGLATRLRQTYSGVTHVVFRQHCSPLSAFLFPSLCVLCLLFCTTLHAPSMCSSLSVSSVVSRIDPRSVSDFQTVRCLAFHLFLCSSSCIFSMLLFWLNLDTLLFDSYCTHESMLFQASFCLCLLVFAVLATLSRCMCWGLFLF